MSKKYTVNQGCMSLSTYYLEYGSHLARLHRRRRAYAPTSNTASHDNHEKINSWASFSFLYGYGVPLCGPSGRRGSANYICLQILNVICTERFRSYTAKKKFKKIVGCHLNSCHSYKKRSERF